jgi:lipopolysaccharide exporter
MSKATKMAQVTAKGGIHLLWGLVVSTIISAVGTIFIARLLSPDSYGLYAIAINAPNLFANFRDWGINTALIKYSAQYNTQNQTKIRGIFLSSILFEIIIGLILTILAFVLSSFLASTFNRPNITPLIQIVSITVLLGALINISTAAFTGLEKMHLNSFVLIVQSIVKTGLIIALVLIGFGTTGAVWGFTTAVLFASLTGMLFMLTIYKSLPKPTDGKLQILANIKIMLKYGVPISISSILLGFLTQFYNYLLAIYVSSNATIGNYNVALNFVVLITFFASPVITMLFPAFSKLDFKNDKEMLKSVFQFSVKYAALIVVPVTAMVISLAQPAIGTIFGNRYSQAPLFLALLSISYLYTALGNLSASNLINSQGYTVFILKLCFLNAAIGFPLGFVLISQFGVIGLIVTSLIVGLPSLVVSLWFIKKRFDVSVNYISSAKILFSSALTALITYFLISELVFSNPVKLAIGLVAFTFIFIMIALLTRTISRSDITNIREIIEGLGPLRRPLNWLFNLIEKLMQILHV